MMSMQVAGQKCFYDPYSLLTLQETDYL